jgi:hypothetical protein
MLVILAKLSENLYHICFESSNLISKGREHFSVPRKGLKILALGLKYVSNFGRFSYMRRSGHLKILQLHYLEFINTNSNKSFRAPNLKDSVFVPA